MLPDPVRRLAGACGMGGSLTNAGFPEGFVAIALRKGNGLN